MSPATAHHALATDWPCTLLRRVDPTRNMSRFWLARLQPSLFEEVLLVRNWGLPPSLSKAIRFHHDLDAYDLPDATLPGASLSLIATTHIAEYMLTALMGERDIEVGQTLFERAIAHLGFGQEETAAETALLQ